MSAQITNTDAAKYEKVHAKLLAQANDERAEMDKKIKRVLENAFKDEESRLKAIKRQIFPKVRAVQTADGGCIGTAFIAGKYLVSNAHVLPKEESLQGISLVNDQEPIKNPSFLRSFHRPVSDCPDVMIAEFKDRIDVGSLDLLNGKEEDNSNDSNRLYFFVWFNFYSALYEVVSLESTDGRNSTPQEWKVEGGTAPGGCSGAPLFQGELKVGREDGQWIPLWSFKIIGMVFARKESDHTCLFAVDISTDMEQLLNFFIQIDGAQWNALIADAAKKMNNSAKQANAEMHSTIGYKLAALRLAAYQAGMSKLTWSLPKGYENLLGTELAPLSESWLLERKKSFKRATGLPKYFTNGTNTTLFSVSSEDELKGYVNELLDELCKEETTRLPTGAETTIFRNDFFRLDVTGGRNGYFLICLQDNIDSRCRKVNNKSISSVFAIAQVPGNILDANTKAIANAIRSSMGKKVAVVYESIKGK